MKAISKKATVWTVAVLSLALVNGLMAADPPDASKTQGTQDRSYQATPTGDQGKMTEQNSGKPARYDRARGIIGLEVRNQNGQRLGRIKDVVFDLNTERLSYAVLAAAHTGFAGINQKYLAVPLSALKVSDDLKHLILNADKAKMQAAAGFDKHNWPSVTTPSWGAEPFWQNGNDKSDRMTPNTTPDKSENPSPVPQPKPAEQQ